MIPSPERFAAKMAERGIGNDDRVIVYDTVGLSSAGRAWWMLRLFGHDNVALLDGGLPRWKAEGRPLETAAPDIPPRGSPPASGPELVRDKAALIADLGMHREQVVDARAAGRFEGTAPGDLAGAAAAAIFRAAATCRSTGSPTRRPAGSGAPRSCKPLFDEAGVRLDRPIVTSCGSGVTACAVAFAAHLLGHPGAAVYDGSWSEWGLPDGPPIETGPAAMMTAIRPYREADEGAVVALWQACGLTRPWNPPCRRYCPAARIEPRRDTAGNAGGRRRNRQRDGRP